MSLTAIASSLAHVLAQVKPNEIDPTTVIHDNPTKDAKTVQDWIETAQRTRQAVQPTKKTQLQLIQVERQELALVQHAKKDHDRAPDVAQIETQLLELRQRYKRLFPNEPEPTDFERDQLNHLARHYPEYARRLIARNPNGSANDEWTAAFFKFCLRSPALSVVREVSAKHWVDIFILYPDEVDHIMSSHLDKRLGQYPENIMIVPGRGLCLHFDVKEGERWVPIQGHFKKTVVFLRNRVNPNSRPFNLSVEEVYRQFKNKTWGYGDVEMCEDGIVAWNAIGLGSKNPDRPEIDSIDPGKWHEALPILTLTYAQLRRRYEGQIVGEPKFGLVLRANREFDDLNVANTHGFFDFVYKLPNGNYRIVPTGFQSIDLPKTWWDRLTKITATERAGIHITDEGHSLSQREQMMIFYSLSEAEGQELIGLVGKEIEKCRSGRRYFQAHGKNCSYVVQRLFDRVIGKDFYKTLEGLAALQLGESQKERTASQLQEAIKSLDPKHFRQFIEPIIEKIVRTNDIPSLNRLLTSTLSTLNRLLQKKENAGIPLPTEDAIREAFRKGNKEEIAVSLINLTELCMDLMHPYRIHLTEGVIAAPLIGHIFRAVRAIPWRWLRNLTTDILLFVLGSWRGHTYEKLDRKTGKMTSKTVRMVWSRNAGRYFNLPAKLFVNCGPEMFKQRSVEISTALAVFSGIAI